MRVLALDLGGKTGYALGEDVPREGRDPEIRLLRSGVWNCMKPGPFFKNGDSRYTNFYQFLAWATKDYPVGEFVYEAVKRHIGTRASHVYGGYEAILYHISEQTHVPVRPCGVSQLKKHATGNGRAGKDLMIRRAKQYFDLDVDICDNEADAICLLRWRFLTDRLEPKS